MMLVGADLMGRALAALERGSLSFTPQADEGVTYAAKIDKAEARIDWTRPAQRGPQPDPRPLALPRRLVRARSAARRARQGAALDAREPAHAHRARSSPDLTVACGEGAVRLVTVQREGKGAMDAPTFLRGAGPLPERAG
jgi:methionyl-tRNA formyltransferase